MNPDPTTVLTPDDTDGENPYHSNYNRRKPSQSTQTSAVVMNTPKLGAAVFSQQRPPLSGSLLQRRRKGTLSSHFVVGGNSDLLSHREVRGNSTDAVGISRLLLWVGGEISPNDFAPCAPEPRRSSEVFPSPLRGERARERGPFSAAVHGEEAYVTNAEKTSPAESLRVSRLCGLIGFPSLAQPANSLRDRNSDRVDKNPCNPCNPWFVILMSLIASQLLLTSNFA
jgi:hypothetical protein